MVVDDSPDGVLKEIPAARMWDGAVEQDHRQLAGQQIHVGSTSFQENWSFHAHAGRFAGRRMTPLRSQTSVLRTPE